MKVFCFHHAGGSALSFADWPPLLAGEAEIRPVQLPGRVGMVSEDRRVALAPLAAELASELAPEVEATSVFFGHSMGALVAFAVVRALAARGEPVPGALIAAAYPAPHLPPPLSEGADPIDASQLLSLLGEIGGLDPRLRVDPRWLDAFLPVLLDDLRLCRGYSFEPEPSLPCRLIGIAAEDDPLVDPDEVAAWALHSRAGFAFAQVRGGHFFPTDSPGETVAIVSRALRELRRDARQSA